MLDLSDHVQFVARVARRFQARLPRSVQLDELVADGVVGLWQATRTFDPSRNVPFHKFALRRIHGAMQDGLRERDWIGRSVRESQRMVEVPRLLMLFRANFNDMTDPRQRRPEEASTEREVRGMVDRLPRRARLALLLYFLEGLSMQATGQVFAMTEAGASMLIKRSVRRLAAAPTPRVPLVIEEKRRIPAAAKRRGAQRTTPRTASPRGVAFLPSYEFGHPTGNPG
jgi:RNA polymerase sigma factor (sigma-70 family)